MRTKSDLLATYHLPLTTALRNLHSGALCEFDGFLVSRVSVARDADPWVVGQHALDASCHFRCAIGHGDLSRMQGISDSDSPAVVD